MYGKVFAQIFDGTLHGQLEATAVFMAMIALADQDGTVDLTLTALTSRTGWPQEFIERGIQQLEAEDSDSRTPDEEGRRIVRLRDNTSWGWSITNYTKYRAIRDADGRRKYMREYMKKRRSKQAVNSVNSRKPKLAQAEVEVEVDINTPLPPKGGKRRKSGRPETVPIPDEFTLSASLADYVVATIPDADPPALFAKFADQARAKAWTYADWPRAFQCYVRNCAPKSGHFAAGAYPRRGAGGIVWE